MGGRLLSPWDYFELARDQEFLESFPSLRGRARRAMRMTSCRYTADRAYWLEITKFTVEDWFAPTLTDFSHVFGSENKGRCTVFSVSTS